MNFVSYEFVVFLLTVWGLFLALPARYRWVLLLVASYIFYATWSIPFIAVIILSMAVATVASLVAARREPAAEGRQDAAAEVADEKGTPSTVQHPERD